MRVAVMAGSILPGQSCGIEHFAYGLIDGLAKYVADADLYIVVPRHGQEEWRRRIQAAGTRVRFIPLTLSAGIGNTITHGRASHWRHHYLHVLRESRAARSLYLKLRTGEEEQVLQEVDPDVVYYPFHRDRLHRSMAFKSIVTVHDLRALQAGLMDSKEAAVVRRNVGLAARVVASWRHPFEDLVAAFPNIQDKCSLIEFPPAIQSAEFKPFPPGANQNVTVLCVSATAPHKNHVRLVEALAQVMISKPSVRLVCVGSKISPGYEMAMESARKLGVADRVEFTGFIPDTEVQNLYTRATMVVAPTLWEAASGAVYEAFTYGKPVACSRIPPIVSQVEAAGASVRWFNPLDPHEIAEAVASVIDNPDPYIAGSLSGKAYISGLTWEHTASRYASLFRNLHTC